MGKLFVSHSSQDDGFVRQLRQALADLNEDAWIDSRELCGGNPLWSEIQKAIEEASAYAVVVSPAAPASLLQQLAADPEAAALRPFIQALQAIVAGNRDRALADAPELDYTMAAEILFLIETLDERG